MDGIGAYLLHISFTVLYLSNSVTLAHRGAVQAAQVSCALGPIAPTVRVGIFPQTSFSLRCLWAHLMPAGGGRWFHHENPKPPMPDCNRCDSNDADKPKELGEVDERRHRCVPHHPRPPSERRQLGQASILAHASVWCQHRGQRLRASPHKPAENLRHADSPE